MITEQEHQIQNIYDQTKKVIIIIVTLVNFLMIISSINFI